MRARGLRGAQGAGRPAGTAVRRPLLSGTSPVAFVTGGAGGIGSAVCRALAGEGFCVAAGYGRSRDAAAALVAELPGGPHLALAADVTDSAALGAAAARAKGELGGCDVLVNAAGVTRFVPHADLDALDDHLIDEILRVNVRGPIAAVRALRPQLEASTRPGGGVVVNVSSIAAVTGMGSNVAYCASKAALDSVTRSLARALAPRIRVVSVAPGVVDTDFIRSLDAAWRDEQLARTPLGRLATPDEVATAVLAVMRDLTFTTGTVLAVDGGRTLA